MRIETNCGTMEHTFKPILLLLMAGIVSFSAMAQQELTEDDIPLNVLSWFYQNYEDPTNIKWSKVDRNGKEHLQATFKENGKTIVSIYNDRGEILEESALTEKPDLPGEISEFAFAKYGKNKAISLRKITKFSHIGKQEKEVYYELVCKAGDEMISVWFDDQYNAQGNRDVSTLARN